MIGSNYEPVRHHHLDAPRKLVDDSQRSHEKAPHAIFPLVTLHTKNKSWRWKLCYKIEYCHSILWVRFNRKPRKKNFPFFVALCRRRRPAEQSHIFAPPLKKKNRTEQNKTNTCPPIHIRRYERKSYGKNTTDKREPVSRGCRRPIVRWTPQMNTFRLPNQFSPTKKRKMVRIEPPCAKSFAFQISQKEKEKMAVDCLAAIP